MLDIRFIRENPDAVRENIKKKFQDAKLPLVDEVIDLDTKRRAAIVEADQLRSNRNTLSKQIGMLMGQAKKDPSKLAEAEGGLCLSYQESELTGMAGTTTVFHVEPEKITLLRIGSVSSEMVFEQGKRHMSLYHTDYGDLSIVVSTQHISSTLTDDGGELDVKYTVEVANTPVGVNHLILNIKNAEEGAIYQ